MVATCDLSFGRVMFVKYFVIYACVLVEFVVVFLDVFSASFEDEDLLLSLCFSWNSDYLPHNYEYSFRISYTHLII